MKKRTTAAAAAVLTCLSMMPAYAASQLSAEDPEAILQVAKGYGSAELSTDSDGDPHIVGRMSGTKYGIYFYGCENGRNCDDIQLRAAWSGPKVSLHQINQWNKDKRYGKAYLDDDNDPTLEISVNLKHGVSRANLDDTFDWFRIAVEGFEKEVLDN